MLRDNLTPWGEPNLMLNIQVSPAWIEADSILKNERSYVAVETRYFPLLHSNYSINVFRELNSSLAGILSANSWNSLENLARWCGRESEQQVSFACTNVGTEGEEAGLYVDQRRIEIVGRVDKANISTLLGKILGSYGKTLYESRLCGYRVDMLGAPVPAQFFIVSVPSEDYSKIETEVNSFGFSLSMSAPEEPLTDPKTGLSNLAQYPGGENKTYYLV